MKKGNLISKISRILEAANRFIVSELEQRGIDNISPSHGDILNLLFDGKALPMQEIALKIHRTKPTVTVLVDKLIEHEYVTKIKCEQDARISYVSLTQKGEKLKPLFLEISKKLNSIVYCGLNDSEAEQMETRLEKIRSNFNK